MNTRAGSEGYVLFLVAVIVGALSLLALMATRVQSQMSTSIDSLRDRMQLELAAQSAAARVSFLLTTQPLGERAILIGADRDQQTTPDATIATRSASGRRIEQFLIDNSFYDWRAPGAAASYAVSLQDEAGLFDLNGMDEVGDANLLRSVGVNNRAAVSLAASLADFVDADDLRRRDGAERADYVRADLAPPPNAPMDSVWTALSVLGWRESLSPSLRNAVFANATAARAGTTPGLNVNTAPLYALEAAFNLNERNARLIIDRRRAAPFRSGDEVRAFTGETPRAEAPQPITMPGNAFRLSVRPVGRAAERGYAYEIELLFGGGQSDRPIYGRSGWLRRSDQGGEQERESLAFPNTAAVLAP